MKSVLPLTFSFLLFAFITKLSLAFSNDVEQVLDINGNPILPGVIYYIFPALSSVDGGGLGLGRTGDSKCAVTIIQSYTGSNSIPVKFTTPGISTDIIFTGTPLEIAFVQRPRCAESAKWLVFVDNISQKSFVGIGGPGNYPGQQTLSGTFNIQKYGSGYKLGFCILGNPTCLHIGRFDNGEEEGGRRLNLTEQDHEPFVVVFDDKVDPTLMDV